MFSDNLEYARHKLDNSVVRISENKHVFIYDICEVDEVLCVDNTEEMIISLDDILPVMPRVGSLYLPKINKVGWISRFPSRTYRFGLCDINSRIYHYYDPVVTSYKDVASGLSEPFFDFSDAFEKVCNGDEREGYPLNKDFILDKNLNFLYKGNLVGVVNETNKSVEIIDEFFYLKEYIEGVTSNGN